MTTPTGDIGSRVLARLLGTDREIRVILRGASKLPDDVRRRVDVLEGSHADAGAIGPPGPPDAAGP